jgi:hypothetical protein
MCSPRSSFACSCICTCTTIHNWDAGEHLERDENNWSQFNTISHVFSLVQKLELLSQKHIFTYNKMSLNWLRFLPLFLRRITLSPGSSKSVLASEAWTAIPACARQVANWRGRTEAEHERLLPKLRPNRRRKSLPISFNASDKIERFQNWAGSFDFYLVFSWSCLCLEFFIWIS